MVFTSIETRLDQARRQLLEAGEAGAEIVETVPGQGGLRQKTVQMLVDLGQAEWIEPGKRARLAGGVKG